MAIVNNANCVYVCEIEQDKWFSLCNARHKKIAEEQEITFILKKGSQKQPGRAQFNFKELNITLQKMVLYCMQGLRSN